MLRRQQFSLNFLLVEVFWLAVALALFRAGASFERQASGTGLPLFFAGLMAFGAAVGGLFGRMAIAAIGIGLAVITLAVLAGILAMAING
jgi:hypothetical protein